MPTEDKTQWGIITQIHGCTRTRAMMIPCFNETGKYIDTMFTRHIIAMREGAYDLEATIEVHHMISKKKG
jgi:hypothetical protein